MIYPKYPKTLKDLALENPSILRDEHHLIDQIMLTWSDHTDFGKNRSFQEVVGLSDSEWSDFVKMKRSLSDIFKIQSVIASNKY